MDISENIKDNNTYDAIVIGSGISGGWAAMELCKKGLKTLLLERGRNVEHIKDYTTANLNPWDLKIGLNKAEIEQVDSSSQVDACNLKENPFYVNAQEYPYIEETPFAWIRGYQVGGRSLTWGRQCYRLSDLDFEANKKDGIGVDWPIRYRDIEAWYDYVETFIGVSGKNEKLPQLPDGKFLPAMELNCIERHLADSIKNNNKNRILTIARIANLTKGWNDRGPCQNRNLCERGCPFGGYFSSNSSTIPYAMATGNLALRPFSIVAEIIYDDKTEKARGVRVVDANTKEKLEFYAKIIFVNASTIATTALLLNSKSERFPNGLGNDSGQLGHNLMDHHSSAGAFGIHHGFKDRYYKGRRPCGFLIPRYQNLTEEERLPFTRGYNIQGNGSRQEWEELQHTSGFGKDFKAQLTTPGAWKVWMAGWGECLPYHQNKISLSDKKVDQWGMPLVKISFAFGENEKRMMDHIKATAVKMLKDAGFSDVQSFNYHKVGGETVHEMGTARMGCDPKTSVLNGFNQLHTVKNVFVTDGSCMTSSASQNPSLTYMALTARACNFAYNELKSGNL